MPESDYEYAIPVTIGGAAGNYTLTSPWGNQSCEYALRVISFAGQGGISVSNDGTLRPAASATYATNTTGGQPGEVIFANAAAVVTPSAMFALSPTGILYVTVTGASNVFATIHFRRRLQFATMPNAYVVNPDLISEEVVHAQRARDLAAYTANPARSEGK